MINKILNECSSKEDNSIKMKVIIEQLILSFNKKEDDLKNIINEKDNIYIEMNKQLKEQSKEIKENKKQIKNLNEELKKVINDNKKKEEKIKELDNKLLTQEKKINDNINEIKGLNSKIFKMVNLYSYSIKKLGNYNFYLDNKIQNLVEYHPGISIEQNQLFDALKSIEEFELDNKSGFEGTKKMNIIFELNNGDKKVFSFENGVTISYILKKYINEFEKSDNRKENISFYYSCKKLNLEDNTKIEKYFQSNNPIIKVMHF